LVLKIEKLETPAYLIDSAADIDIKWFEGKNIIGLTAGASAPEVLVQQVVSHLKTVGVCDADEDNGARETVEFSLPKALKVDISQLSK
jgi:4-hydroxy-3-methylbut-2-enyl diphosphate reductase